MLGEFWGREVPAIAFLPFHAHTGILRSPRLLVLVSLQIPVCIPSGISSWKWGVLPWRLRTRGSLARAAYRQTEVG